MISVSIKETFEKTITIDTPPNILNEEAFLIEVKKLIRDKYDSAEIHLGPEDCKSIEVSIDNADYQRYSDMLIDIWKAEGKLEE